MSECTKSRNSLRLRRRFLPLPAHFLIEGVVRVAGSQSLGVKVFFDQCQSLILWGGVRISKSIFDTRWQSLLVVFMGTV